MPNCEYLEKCSFFNDKIQNMPSAADMVKEMYCKGNFKECARYMIFIALGKEKLPPDLFPNDMVKARVLLIQHNKY